MVRLTEEMIAARTRVSDCASVKKLNCWGTELTDVSILRKMKNVEVLSLSVNNISSLADFQNCVDLKDLFIRKNNITDLNQVCYLQGLPNLKNLWLGENPCAEEEGYRFSVIKALPQLEKLDEKIVTPEEVQAAMIRGRTLVLPLSGPASPPSPPQSDRGSPEVPAKYIEDQRHQQIVDQRQQHYSSDEQQSHDEASVVDDYHEIDKKNANYNKSPMQQFAQNNRYSYENAYPTSPRQQYAPQEYIDDRQNEYEEVQRPPSAQSRRGGMNVSTEREDLNHTPVWIRRSNEKDKRRMQYQRRPVTRNSNILSAVLCLVKELDYPSLEVVEMAVRSRIEELEE